ncbi:MAG TPA: glycosyltransferase family 2 protein [Candidatus Paceibacterota bacterium]
MPISEPKPQLSIVIPVFNEVRSVAILHGELVSVLRRLGRPFEIIFIDDGSTDATLAELKKLSPARIVSFTRNFGKSQALQAGFRLAQGEYIFTIDGDLQDDPAEIPNFLRLMETANWDLVCGWKQARKDSWSKRLVSKAANVVTAFFTRVKIHDMNCGYKLYRREVATTIHLFGDMHRYIPALAATHGFRIGEIPVHHRPRTFGVSKYGNSRRFFKSFFDFVSLILLNRFMDRPMHLFGLAGFFLSGAGFATLLYLSWVRLYLGELIGNRPLLLLGVLLMVVGLQFFFSGFLGELLIRQESGAKKLYEIRETFER